MDKKSFYSRHLVKLKAGQGGTKALVQENKHM